MKQIVLLLFSALLSLLIAGCELVTEEPDLPAFSPADHLVINEVFSLPIDHPATYSWIEFYNPTPDTINLTNWSLSYTTFRLNTTITVAIDTQGNFFPFQFVTAPDSFGVFAVPFAEGVLDIPFLEEDTVELPPGGLFTLVSDEDRLLDHTNWGPGDERFRRERGAIEGPIDGFSVVDSTDTLITVQVTYKSYALFLQTTDQLVLKDPAGNVVDVVRYGSYVYSGPATDDPAPNNVSWGSIPEFQTIQRYAGAYSTGSTANDFYPSNSSVVPTPHWYSTEHHR